MAGQNENIAEILKPLIQALKRGNLIPVVSNSFRIEQIFYQDDDLLTMMATVPEFYDEFKSFDQQLIKRWAQSIDYPMSDDHNLARVAQYLQVVEESSTTVREKYMLFLIERILALAEAGEDFQQEEEYRTAVSLYHDLVNNIPLPLLSDVANQLGYPRFMEGVEDPLRLLARMPIKIFMTTGFSSFLEQALEREGKTPRTQLCFCQPGLIEDALHKPDRDLVPSVQEPVVVHLFGLEDHPQCLVLSEDDHISFLTNAALSLNDDEQYPSYLRRMLGSADTSFLLLGYHPRDWEFRTLFHLLAMLRRSANVPGQPRSFAIQFRPSLGKKDVEERSVAYLQKYFAELRFRVAWKSADEFIYALHEAQRQP